ncbi:hypothetical protein HMPREF0044_0377 [Gleimia coleocanis DSM 15436]|uniref:Uncharacterized protein n=1 Tax=Gleimia coleocanis DSM 15436 TaxID=525245 RepID=C0VYY7_9ACTO|nr:hypothetical protein HMPREF0044_0377 [Gleimia coleocanis DSM 15436]
MPTQFSQFPHLVMHLPDYRTQTSHFKRRLITLVKKTFPEILMISANH